MTGFSQTVKVKLTAEPPYLLGLQVILKRERDLMSGWGVGRSIPPQPGRQVTVPTPRQVGQSRLKARRQLSLLF